MQKLLEVQLSRTQNEKNAHKTAVLFILNNPHYVMALKHNLMPLQS